MGIYKMIWAAFIMQKSERTYITQELRIIYKTTNMKVKRLIYFKNHLTVTMHDQIMGEPEIGKTYWRSLHTLQKELTDNKNYYIQNTKHPRYQVTEPSGEDIKTNKFKFCSQLMPKHRNCIYSMVKAIWTYWKMHLTIRLIQAIILQSY